MALTFERIKAIHLAEKSNSDLSKVEPDFYTQLKKFLEEEKQKFQENMSADVENLDPGIIYYYKNLLNIVREILALRTEKVLKKALYDALHTHSSSLEHMVEWERDLYDHVRREVQHLVSQIMGEGSALNLVRVRILTDIPVFVGPDLREYGPFRMGEEVPLPREVAEILKSKGQAEVIE